MNSVTDSTQNGLPHDHRWLTAWVLDKNHNIAKDEYDGNLIVVCNKNVCNILNVTVMTMPWWNKAKAQQK